MKPQEKQQPIGTSYDDHLGNPMRVFKSKEFHTPILMDMFTPNDSFTWGLKELDLTFSPIERGRFIVLFGQAGSGKTQYALHMARENSKMGTVLFISLEMGIKQIVRNYALKRNSITKQSYCDATIPIKDSDKVISTLHELDRIHFTDMSHGGFSVERINYLIDRIGAEMVFIDNLNKIDVEGDNDIEKDNNVSKQLQDLSRAKDIPVIVIHHANKPPNKTVKSKVTREDRLPFRGIGGMRGTNKIMDDADMVLEMCRPTPEFVHAASIEDVPKEDEKRSIEYEYGVRYLCGLYMMKDRDWGDHVRSELYFWEGQYQKEISIDLFNNS